MKRILIFAALLLTLSACTQTEVMTCSDEPLYLQFKGLDPAELDTVVVNSYEAGSGYSRLLTTDTLPYPPNAGFYNGDTIRAPYNYQWAVRPGADYEVLVPATGGRTRISDIRQEGQKAEVYKRPWMSKVDIVPCVNAITGFRVDSTQVAVAAPETEPNYATVHR